MRINLAEQASDAIELHAKIILALISHLAVAQLLVNILISKLLGYFTTGKACVRIVCAKPATPAACCDSWVRKIRKLRKRL